MMQEQQGAGTTHWWMEMTGKVYAEAKDGEEGEAGEIG
jgi:hypothetical protein